MRSTLDWLIELLQIDHLLERRPATLSGGDDPTGTITFKLFGPNNNDCSGTPASTSASTVVGNGSYQSGAYTVTQPGTYRWVVDYSGDDNNKPAGPTTCGDNTETVTITPAAWMVGKTVITITATSSPWMSDGTWLKK